MNITHYFDSGNNDTNILEEYNKRAKKLIKTATLYEKQITPILQNIKLDKNK